VDFEWIEEDELASRAIASSEELRGEEDQAEGSRIELLRPEDAHIA
jgi:hypothetical protein